MCVWRGVMDRVVASTSGLVCLSEAEVEYPPVNRV